jgi:L-alanine-DL-glutamate epimerase-like enolase superfamily enzyme
MTKSTRINSVRHQGERLRVGVESGAAGFAPVSGKKLPPLDFMVGMDASALLSIRARIEDDEVAALVEAACIDCVARSSMTPAYQWLGGPTRFKVRGLTLLEGNAVPKGPASLRVPLPPKAPARAFVDSVRKLLDGILSIAPDAELVLDGRGALAPAEAARLLPALETYHLLWFNEPCSSKDPGEIAKLCEESVTPLGFGESFSRPVQFAPLIDAGAVQCLRLNVAKLGPLGVRKVAALGESEYLGVSVTSPAHAWWESAAIHVAGSLANVTHVDLQRTTMQDEYALLRHEPGFGMEGA